MKEFANRMNRIKGSAIRELFKLVADPSIISLGGGNPAKESFPTEDIARISHDLILEKGSVILQYGGTEGYLPLRKAIIEKLLPDKNLKADIDELLITAGSTQAMDLLSKVFINPGDTILVESPTFLGAIQTYNGYEANIIPVPSDSEGILVDELEKLIKEHNPKFVYCIPTFQNPTGKTLGISRRKRIAELAAEYDVIVLEDDPYCDLRYEGEALPPIKTFDTSDNVIYLGSFSKTISPGLRIGFALGNSAIIRKMTIAKQGNDIHCSNISQAIVAEYLNEDLLKPHLAVINSDYRIRRDAMLNAIKKSFPDTCKFIKPEGGLFVWCEFEDKAIKAENLFRRSVDEKQVAFVPGEYFFINPDEHKNTFRLNFSAENTDRIELGVTRLAELINEVSGN